LLFGPNVLPVWPAVAVEWPAPSNRLINDKAGILREIRARTFSMMRFTRSDGRRVEPKVLDLEDSLRCSGVETDEEYDDASPVSGCHERHLIPRHARQSACALLARTPHR